MNRLRRLLVGSILGFVLLIAVYVILTALVRESPFSDEGLEAAVRDQLGSPGSHIALNDLETLSELNASGRGIESLEGIEALPNLRELNLADNRVADLSPLAGLSRLAALDLSNNYLADPDSVNLGALEVLSELTELRLANNREPAHPEAPGDAGRLWDISVLTSFSALEVLDLRDNHIEDISPLSGLEYLRVLDLRGNRLSEDAVEALRPLSRLESLNLRENDLRDIEALSALQQLEYLNLHSNYRVESILPMASLSRLRTLILRGVTVGEQAEIFREFGNLERLNLRDTGMRDLRVLAELMEQGALQDRPEEGVFAELDIRENPVGDAEGYRVLEPYWSGIAVRRPAELPE